MQDYGASVKAFVQRLKLGAEGRDLLLSLPEEVCSKVIKSFSPAGCKDGNIFARLEAFANSLHKSHIGKISLDIARSRPASGVPKVQEFVHNHYHGSNGLLSQRQGERKRFPSTPAPFGRGQRDVASNPENQVSDYLKELGLSHEDTALLQALPDFVLETIMIRFDPSGTKDGNVMSRLLAFARPVWAQTLGFQGQQAQEAAAMLRGLPDQAQMRVMAEFDATGTKDGNVLARLQRFVAAVAERRGLHQAPILPSPIVNTATRSADHGVASAARTPATTIGRGLRRSNTLGSLPNGSVLGGCPGTRSGYAIASFARRFGCDPSQTLFLSRLDEDIQAVLVSSFNPDGTKDGNVWGRLFGFVRSVWTQRVGLDAGAIDYMKKLPEEMQRLVITRFDPLSSKNGNTTASLEAFIRSRGSGGCRQSDNLQPHHLLGARQRTQPILPIKADTGVWGAQRNVQGAGSNQPMHVKEGGGSDRSCGALDDFVRHWGLNADAADFFAALPESVSSAVFDSFVVTGTKDGNVWGRLFGFVRSVWIAKMGLDTEETFFLRKLPEQVQAEVMVNFDPQSKMARSLGLEGYLHQLVEEAELGQQDLSASSVDTSIQKQTTRRSSPPQKHTALDDVVIDEFLERCGLDDEVVHILSNLQPDVLTAVVNDFDPGGTKDGNVQRRLEGFVRAVEARTSNKRTLSQQHRQHQTVLSGAGRRTSGGFECGRSGRDGDSGRSTGFHRNVRQRVDGW
eukprot:TRINITY_DN38457_c0_g1_i1.p1 TRINITY_DN38457_c0_g1~~TRINITY_DN38457_c0_g1_i1.p1  ORF type:complete len:738 (+),score=112.39 TRINITY_DN38457_c0_g1_i1:110-2323(+)